MLPSPLAAESTPLLPQPQSSPTAGQGAPSNAEPPPSWQASRARSQSSRRRLPWWKRPSPLWLLPGHCLFTALNGAGSQVTYEIMNRLACLDILPPATSPNDLHLSLKTYVPDQKNDDAEWLSACRKSSAVQKRTTRFVTLNMMVGGVLAACTSSYWGGCSDRFGRRPLLLLGSLSDIISYSGQLLVALHPELGFKFLLCVTAFAYSLGGGTTAQAVIYAYASDCVSVGSRVSTFALVDAALSLGLILGPIIGSLVVHFTGKVLTPFYSMIAMRALYLLVLAFLIPESLSSTRKFDENRRRKADLESRSRLPSAWAWHPHTIFLKALAPLAVLGPPSVGQEAEGEGTEAVLTHRRSESGRGKWNMVCIGIVFTLASANPAITPIKILYSRFKFGWQIEQTGYWTSFNSLSKLFVLLCVLPLATRFFRRKELAQVRRDQDGDLTESGVEGTPGDGCEAQAIRSKLIADSHFDLRLALFSILISVFGYLIMALPNKKPTTFLISTALVQGSGGIIPSLQSLALTLTAPRDSGRVLAALSVLAAFSVQVVGPPFFGSVYIATVDRAPELAFLVAALWWAVSLIPLNLAELPHT